MNPAAQTFVDYVTSSYKFPLVLGLVAGLGVSMFVMTFFPNAGKGYDPGAIVLLSFGLPMTVVTIAAMIWARRYRASRARAAAPVRVTPRRGS